MKDDTSKSLLAYSSSPKQAPADGFLVSHSRWAFSLTSKCPILTAESAQEDKNYPISKHVASVSEATCLIHRRVLDCLRRYLQHKWTSHVGTCHERYGRNALEAIVARRTSYPAGNFQSVHERWELKSVLPSSSFPRKQQKNLSRSILPHLSAGPRCRPKAPATKLLSTRLEAVSSVRLPQVTETLIFAWKMMPQVSVSKLGSSETKYWRTPVSGVKPEEENENVTEWCEEQKTHITYVYGWEASGPRKQRPLYNWSILVSPCWQAPWHASLQASMEWWVAHLDMKCDARFQSSQKC